jgi:hypothetical protein
MVFAATPFPFHTGVHSSIDAAVNCSASNEIAFVLETGVSHS